MMNRKRMFAALLSLLMMLALAPAALAVITVDMAEYDVQQDGWYDSMEEVAIYLTFFEELPGNYLTKKEAQALGWESRKGNLWEVADGCSIGGDRFGNYEGLLPEAKGRKWTECDIDFDGGYRGGERIVFSNDGLIYYTDDHYETFDEIEIVCGAPEEGAVNGAEYEPDDELQYEEEDASMDSSALVDGVVDVLYWLFAE